MHRYPFELLQEIYSIDLMHAEGIDPLLHVMEGWCTDQHRSLDHTRLAEDDPESMLSARFL